MNCPSDARAFPLGRFLPQLAVIERVRQAIALEYQELAEVILRSALEGREDEVIGTGAWDTITELIRNESISVEELSGDGPDEDTFLISVLQFGPVFWVEAQEFDADGYFATLEDAVSYAESKFAPFMACADEEDHDGEQSPIEPEGGTYGVKPPCDGTQESGEPHTLISEDGRASEMRRELTVDDQGRWGFHSAKIRSEAGNSSHGVSIPFTPGQNVKLPIEDESAFWASFPADEEGFAAHVRHPGIVVTYIAVITSRAIQPAVSEQQTLPAVPLPNPPGRYRWQESGGGMIQPTVRMFRLWRNDLGYFPLEE